MKTSSTQAMYEDKFSSMARNMNKWVDQVLGPTYHKYCPAETWTPSINLYEDDREYWLVVDLAGMKPQEIDVKAENGLLTVRGHRPTPGMKTAAGSLKLHHMEIDHGPFCRTLELPRDADLDALEASYKAGLLWVRIPKKT